MAELKQVPLTVDTIAKLELKKNDVIVIQAPLSNLSREQILRLKEAITEVTSKVFENKVIVVDKNMSITVVTMEENQ